MKFLVKLFGVLMVLSGISLLIKPDIIFDWVADELNNSSIFIFSIMVRIILGIVFIIAAKESKYPVIIKFFGFLFIIAALIFIFMGSASFNEFFLALIPKMKPYAVLSGLIDIAIGAFLIYAFSGKRELIQEID